MKGNKAHGIIAAIVAIAAIALLCLFLSALIGGTVNHGSVLGSAFCLAVLLLCVFYPKMRENRVLRAISRTLCVLLSVAAVYAAAISALIVSGITNTPQRAVAAGTFGAGEPQTVIILGCRAINGEPSLMLRARLDCGIEYLNENPSAVCIVTGGQGADETEPESVSMKRYLISNGISESRIYTEENSSNTRENISGAAEIIKKHGLPERTVVVSEGYHVYRGVRIAERNGLKATALSAFSEETWFTLPSYWVREIFAVTYDFLVGE